MGRRSLRTIQEKFESIKTRLVIDDNGCWNYVGHTNSAGYGVVCCENMIDLPHNKGQVTTHKLSYLYHYSRMPKDTILLHSCDNRRCCNPDHLSAGTRKENTMDAQRKGRLKGINYLQLYGMTRTELAKKLGITPGNLSNRMRKWGHPHYNKNKLQS
mgnify:FL=1